MSKCGWLKSERTHSGLTNPGFCYNKLMAAWIHPTRRQLSQLAVASCGEYFPVLTHHLYDTVYQNIVVEQLCSFLAKVVFFCCFFSTTCLEEDNVSCFLGFFWGFFQGTNNHLMVSVACQFIQVVLRSQLRRARSYYIQEIKYLQALLTLPKHWIHPNPCDISFLLC